MSFYKNLKHAIVRSIGKRIIDVLQQVICLHDVEKLGISVLEIYEDS
jgi:hypothetical protein